MLFIAPASLPAVAASCFTSLDADRSRWRECRWRDSQSLASNRTVAAATLDARFREKTLLGCK